MNKKAASLIISYVLIIGLSIALAVAIGLWSKSESEKVMDTTVKESEMSARCADVRLGGFRCSKEDGNIEIKIKNRGSFNIVSLRYICIDKNSESIGSGKLDLDGLLPGEEEPLNINKLSNCNIDGDITLTPFIRINDREVICDEGEKIIDSTEQC